MGTVSVLAALSASTVYRLKQTREGLSENARMVESIPTSMHARLIYLTSMIGLEGDGRTDNG